MMFYSINLPPILTEVARTRTKNCGGYARKVAGS